MRLLFIIDSFGPGGAQRQMTALSAALIRRGHSVEYFIYYSAARHFWPEGVVVHACPKRSRWSVAPLFFLSRLMRGGRFDAALSFLETPNFYAEVANLGPGRIPLVVSERSSFPAGRLPWMLRSRQWFHRLATRIVVNSHHQRERMLAEFPWMAGRIGTIENGVDPKVFDSAVFRAEERTSRRLVLLAVGRIDEGKNPAALIHALAEAKAAGEPLPRIRWAGDTEPSPAGRAYHAEMLRLIDLYGLSGDWEWLGTRQDVPALLAESDALVHPSLFEGFSNVVCEAMAAGRPVLAGRIGDHADIIEEGVTGFIFDPKDPRDLGRALRALRALSSEERLEMGRRAAARARERFTLELFVERYERLFAGLGKTRPAA